MRTILKNDNKTRFENLYFSQAIKNINRIITLYV